VCVSVVGEAGAEGARAGGTIVGGLGCGGDGRLCEPFSGRLGEASLPDYGSGAKDAAVSGAPAVCADAVGGAGTRVRATGGVDGSTHARAEFSAARRVAG